jgi:hypothetical protein
VGSGRGQGEQQAPEEAAAGCQAGYPQAEERHAAGAAALATVVLRRSRTSAATMRAKTTQVRLEMREGTAAELSS